MADSENHLDSGSAGVGTLSPESSEGCSLPSTSISLDFDPMSFKFKESSPIASPTDEKITNGLNCPNNGAQGTPLDLDYFENLNITNQDKSLTDGPTNQPDIISSSVLKDHDSIEFQDSGPHSPNNELLLVSASTIGSDPNATVSTESITYGTAEVETKCVLTSVTNKYSLIELNEENQEESYSSDNLHDDSEQHESAEINKSDANFYLSSSDAVESECLSQDRTSVSFEETEENMNKKIREVKTIVSEKITTEYHQINGNRSQYVNHAEQAISQSPPKEIIDTGIDFESLKTSYTQHAQEHRSLSPSREAIATGIDINTLKTSLIRPQDAAVPKSQELIETGISVKSLKSSFNQSQDYQSTPVEEVKLSIDKDQLTRKFSQDSNLLLTLQDQHGSTKDDATSLCKICGKHVYQMEKIFAEKNAFHKSCFRCKECGKSLNVDTYFSNEGEIFCNPHFKLLFQPKVRFDDDSEQMSKIDDVDSAQGCSKKHEMISESTPVELPPDVVRSDTKAADGLEKIPDLSNIRSWFESPQEQQQQHIISDSTLQRSESILARMAKYQSAVSGEQENGHLSPTEDETDDIKMIKNKEKVSFSEMSNLKNQWESGSVTVSKDENIEQKEELSKLRKQFSHGSGRVKTIYEKACQQTTKTSIRTETDIEVGEDISARLIKEKFEKGVVKNDDEIEKQEKVRKEKEDDLSIFSEGAATHDARNLFKQIDAAGAKVPLPLVKSPNKSPSNESRRTREIQYFSPTSPVETELIKCTNTSKEEIVESIEVSERFKFFENYKEIPSSNIKDDNTEKEIPRDPNIIRSSDVVDDIPVTDTTRRMLDKFKALESNVPENITPVVPKPAKRIVPKDFIKVEDSEPVSEQVRDPNIIKASYKCDDDIIIEADKAKSLRAKFENWENEVIRENKKNEDEDNLPQADIAKNLRAKFESIKGEPTATIEKPKSKVNRFIQEQSTASMEVCDICGRRLYPMEKMETSGQKLHKNCFRCAHCSCILRLENYTTSGGKLYCTPHFKQLFISRGNYDEGFGREQHKEKWNRSRSNTPILRDLSQNGDSSEYTNGDTKSILQGTFDQQVVA